MHRRALVHALAGACLLVVAAACGESDAAAPEVASTIGDVGALPGPLPTAPTVPSSGPPVTNAETSVPASAPTTSGASTVPTSMTLPVDQRRPIGRLVDGNRVLVIGDSILASISNRYGDQLCRQLVPRGWAVEVDAEVGRFVEFGREVLEQRPVEDWDAAVVMLGNNYRGDPQAFADELDRLLDELEPLPVLLANVTRFEPAQDEVNFVVVGAANRRPDVQLLDWTARTADDAPDVDDLLTGDGLHLTATGQGALATMIGRAMGRAPSGSTGQCLRSTFDDDDDGGAVGRP